MPSDNTIVLTQACYSYQDYVDALRACIDPDPAALIGHELVYDDLLGAFIYEMNSRNLDNLIMHLHAVLDEDDDGSAWQGQAAKLVKKIRELIEDEDVRLTLPPADPALMGTEYGPHRP